MTRRPAAGAPGTLSREALETRERQLREAQQLARIGSWEFDLATRTVSWSDELYRVYELDPETFQPTYDDTMRLVHPDDRVLIESAVARALTNPGPFAIDFRAYLPDGRLRVFHSRGQVVCGTDGRPTRLI